jgi:transcriptional regulator with XRE-family HTH domain
MPSTGRLLTEAERNDLGPWLDEARKRARKSKYDVADAIGDSSLTRVNRYLLKSSVPTQRVLATIAAAIEVPWPVAFLRAGYFREVLGAVTLCSIAALPARKIEGRLDPQIFRHGLISFMLRAFPRRALELADDGQGNDVDERSLRFIAAIVPYPEPPQKGKSAELLSRRFMHPMLARASDALEDEKTPADVRRFVAGEYVNAWANAFDLKAARIIRGDASRAFSEPFIRRAEQFAEKQLVRLTEEIEGA